MVEAGMVRCARCGELIHAGESWDLGHVDGTGRSTQGQSIDAANRATETRKRRRVSLQW
jgi:hypothetical protein